MLRYVNVFISAISARAAARDAVISAGMYPLGFDTHLPTGGSAEAQTRQLIDLCDIFVGIYGQQESPWLAFEYEYALQQQKEMIFFIPWNAMQAEADSLKDKVMRQHKINEFDDQQEQSLKGHLLQTLSMPPLSQIGHRRMVVEPIFEAPSRDPQFQADVFMVMPFRPELRPIYDDHVKKVVAELGLSIKRGDDFFAHHAIMQDIWSVSNAARVIIADCTGKNPNVFYEMGIAHTLGKPIIMITQNADDIPFDLRHLRYIPYEYTPQGMPLFENQLRQALMRLLP